MLSIRMALFTAVVASLPVFAQDYFAAIAYSRSTTHFGTANNDLTLADAQNDALRDCGYKDCVVMAFTTNGCVAGAFSYPSERTGIQWFGFSNGTSKDEAEKLSLQICEFDAKDYCIIQASFCTTQDTPPEPPANVDDVLKLTPEGSPEALGILKLVNVAAAKYLIETVGLAPYIANKIGAGGPYGLISDFVTETGVGMATYHKLLGFALANGYIKH